MLLVICGNESKKLDSVLGEIRGELGSRAVGFDMGYLTNATSRLNRLKIEVGRGTFGGAIKLITGINDESEMQYLRNSGAVIAHVYGAMGKIYDCISIAKTDLFVGSNFGYLPKHVFTPKQLISEVEIKNKLSFHAKQRPSTAYGRLKQSICHRP